HDHAQHETEDRAEQRAPDRLDTAEVRYPLIAAARSADDVGEETEIGDDFHALDDEPLHGTPPDRRRYRIGSERAAGDSLCRAEVKPRPLRLREAVRSGSRKSAVAVLVFLARAARAGLGAADLAP